VRSGHALAVMRAHSEGPVSISLSLDASLLAVVGNNEQCTFVFVIGTGVWASDCVVLQPSS